MLDKLRSIRWRFPGREEPVISAKERLPLSASIVREEKAKPEPVTCGTGTAKKVFAQKRRYPRYPVDGHEVQAHMLFSEEVVIQNLSVSGACIRTIRDLQVGGRYLLRIEDRQPPLALQSMVIWRRAEENRQDLFQGFLAGVQFLAPAFEEIVRLKDFMRLYGSPDEEKVDESWKPSALRFHIRQGEKALLNGQEVLEVKKISLGGMLVGSSRQLDVEGRYFMKIRLSPEIDPIKIKGRIASVILPHQSTEQMYDIGVEFLDMEVLDKARLDRFIRAL